jgi:transposase-like protein
VSTRRVDELVQAMGLAGISKSQVSKLCKDIDERVNAFLDRPIEGEWPYLWLDATYLKVRDGGRIVSVAAIIAMAVTTDGRREIIGLGLGPSEAEPFWSAFLKGLVKRGLKGVKLVISDAHDGLRLAITRVLGASWQRCRVGLLKKPLFLCGICVRQAAIVAKVEENCRVVGGVGHTRPLRKCPTQTKRTKNDAASRLRLIAAAVRRA